jgi:epoxyqueuosine reductase
MNSNDVKMQVLKSGATLCGIAPVERFTDAPKGFAPTDLYPETRSVISIALQMPKTTLNLPTHIPYTVVEEIALKETHRIAFELMMFLEANDHEATIVPSEPYEYWDAATRTGKGLVSLKHIGHKCGIGVFGKNHLLYNPQLGSLMRLGAVLTNATLEPDKMLEKEICTPGCKLCIESCPAGAINENGVNQKKCREYSQGKSLKGDLLYACNICRRVCKNVCGTKQK